MLNSDDIKLYIDLLEAQNKALKKQNKELQQELKNINVELKAENARLKEEKGGMQILIDNYIALTEKYHQTLQEIKAIAESVCRDDCPDLKNGYCIGLGECSFRARKQIIDLITKAESEKE